jgi:hypothetical protein
MLFFGADYVKKWGNCKIVCWHFSQYSTICQLYDGDQFLLVEERTQIRCAMYVGRDHRPFASKLTNILTQTDQLKQNSNRRCLLVRDLVV